MARAKAAADGDGGAVSQADMVRDGLATLGADAKPKAVQEHIRTKYGKEVSRIIISNYKSNMKKGRLGGPGGASPRAAGRPRKAAGAGAGGSVRLDDLEAVRGLVGRLGTANVRRLVDLLS